MVTYHKNELVIYLKSGATIEIFSEATADAIKANMSLEPGKCLSFNEGSFIICSEIAAVMVKK